MDDAVIIKVREVCTNSRSSGAQAVVALNVVTPSAASTVAHKVLHTRCGIGPKAEEGSVIGSRRVMCKVPGQRHVWARGISCGMLWPVFGGPHVCAMQLTFNYSTFLKNRIWNLPVYLASLALD